MGVRVCNLTLSAQWKAKSCLDYPRQLSVSYSVFDFSVKDIALCINGMVLIWVSAKEMIQFQIRTFFDDSHISEMLFAHLKKEP